MADFRVDVSAAPAHEHVAVVSFERPPRNYFTPELIGVLADVLEELSADGRTRVVVLRGEGRHFCAGADLGEAAGLSRAAGQDDAPDTGPSGTGPSGTGPSATGPQDGDDVDLDVEGLYQHAIRLFAQPLPMVAQLHGAVIGGGLGLALAADFRVAVANARLAANFTKLGIHQGFGLSVTLPRLVGEQCALDLLLTGRTVRGDEAFSLGLVDLVATVDQLEETTLAKAAELAVNAPLAVRAVRQTMREGLIAQLRDAVRREAAEQRKLFRTADFREGVSAAAERRPARFSNR
ncbi:MAG TPA: enoyl-CoA hydratase/isomerase family protein [Trebonia sp.]|nr:enoyl-CoA hydratase/isomerase family protein [Trebonia sp.]